jgi:hypothetical protein
LSIETLPPHECDLPSINAHRSEEKQFSLRKNKEDVPRLTIMSDEFLSEKMKKKIESYRSGSK